MKISFSKPSFLGSMLVFVGVAQKYQYHIGTIFSHTQPVERMLRLYLLWSFYTQVNHQRNFESPKKLGVPKKRWRHETPFLEPLGPYLFSTPLVRWFRIHIHTWGPKKTGRRPVPMELQLHLQQTPLLAVFPRRHRGKEASSEPP